ncbi:MAG: threonine/serine exporter family protein [Candidatus Cloacimonetes bacterium]|nr:threonine/serine exporter family protein [Candidatus Cloacimonadota bacterium]NLO10819.1 threonine/serine exporter family protein [Candidatus Cloacimonadota bacterium]
MSHIPIHEAADIVSEVGRILLSSGATTNRVELMMRKAATCFGYGKTEAYVTPTGIFITVSDGSDKQTTSVQRIEGRRNDLGKISAISHLINRLQMESCKAESPSMSVTKLRAELYKLDNFKPWPAWFQIFSGGTTSGFFCLLFGGSWLEFAVAYLVGVLVTGAMRLAGMAKLNNFLLNALGAALVVIFAKTLDIWVPYIKIDNIIIGGIMLLAPGLSMVNAIRDTMSGDLVSGTARGVEAVFIAVAIAAGSGTMLKLWDLLGY